MFEQSLYDREPVYAAEPSAEGDLFHHYEIRSWDVGPRIYKIFAIAAVANILAILFVAQTPLLTMKGCDSPLVSSVCQALDTVALGAAVFGTEREYIDAAYDTMDLKEADVTFVDVSGEVPPLSYPEGYFNLANPERLMQASVEQTADPFGMPSTTAPFPSYVPVTPPSSGSPLTNTTPKYPKHNNNVIAGDLPDKPGETADADDKPAKPGKVKPGASPSPSPGDTTAKTDVPKVDPTAPVTDVELNKRPIADYGDLVNGMIDRKEVNIESPFLMTATGKLVNGRLDGKTFKYKFENADPNMQRVILEGIKALDASGYLNYLTMSGIKDVKFIVQQDGQNVTASVESQFDNELRPKTITTLLTGYINSKKEAKSAPDASQNDKDDLVLLQNAAVTPTGKKLVISFNLPKADLQRMLQRKLAEQKAAPKMQNNNVSARSADNTARN